MKKDSPVRSYLSLIILFIPAVAFLMLIIVFRDFKELQLQSTFPFLPWQFLIIAIAGVTATLGGVLDWKYHRNPLNMRIPTKERDAEVAALGLGGIPMFVLMWLAMMSESPNIFLLPILLVLIYTVVMISYDEFVFHRKRCGKLETLYHRMLVFGNGIAWISWFHFIYY